MTSSSDMDVELSEVKHSLKFWPKKALNEGSIALRGEELGVWNSSLTSGVAGGWLLKLKSRRGLTSMLGRAE